MEGIPVHEHLLKYARDLQHHSCDLRSKLTSLILYVEESEEIPASSKERILQCSQTLTNKSNELLDQEEQLFKLVSFLFPGSDIHKDSLLK